MNETYIKLFRRLLDNPLLARDNNAYTMFTKLLLKVDYKTGSITLGRQQLAVMCNLKMSTAYITAKRLQDNSMITMRPSKKFTTFTVVNWSKYQSKNQSEQQQYNSSTTVTWAKPDTIQEEEELDTKVSKASPVRKKEYGKSEINDLHAYWNETIGISITGAKAKNRISASNLLKVHGYEGVKTLVRTVKAGWGKEFAPQCADFIELEAKQNKVVSWGAKQKVVSNKKILTGYKSAIDLGMPQLSDTSLERQYR